MIEKDKKEIKGYIKKLVDHFDKQVKKIDKNSDDRIKGYIENVNDRFKTTAEGMTGINERLEKIEKTLDSHSEQLANLLVDSNSAKLDMADIRYQVKMNLDEKVNKRNFVDLESRVRVLEKNK